MKVSVITPVQDRPRGVDLCARWLRRQTYPIHEWIVVDDGKVPCEPKHDKAVHIRRSSRRYISLPENVFVAIGKVTGDAILYMEDDDWYGPRYVQEMVRSLEKGGIVALTGIRSYNVRFFRYGGEIRYYRELPKKKIFAPHSAVRRDLLRVYHYAAAKAMKVKGPSRGNAFGVKLWNYAWKYHADEVVLLPSKEWVSIKGIQGRAITKAHWSERHFKNQGLPKDRDRSVLRSWVGEEDAELLMEAGKAK